MFIVVFLGWLFALWCNSLVGELVRKLWVVINADRLPRYDCVSSLLGRLDVTFFYIIFYAVLVNPTSKFSGGLLTLVGIWLTIKALPAIWKIKGEEPYPPIDKKIKSSEAGERYNVYLIGTMLNILTAFMSSVFAVVLKNAVESDINSTLLILFTIVISIYLFIIDCTNKIPDTPQGPPQKRNKKVKQVVLLTFKE